MTKIKYSWCGANLEWITKIDYGDKYIFGIIINFYQIVKQKNSNKIIIILIGLINLINNYYQ